MNDNYTSVLAKLKVASGNTFIAKSFKFTLSKSNSAMPPRTDKSYCKRNKFFELKKQKKQTTNSANFLLKIHYYLLLALLSYLEVVSVQE